MNLYQVAEKLSELSSRGAGGDEESAFSLAFCEKQIPRCARNDNESDFFSTLL